jgi:hypothetical protein
MYNIDRVDSQLLVEFPRKVLWPIAYGTWQIEPNAQYTFSGTRVNVLDLPSGVHETELFDMQMIINESFNLYSLGEVVATFTKA